jgi:hypothetical protein
MKRNEIKNAAVQSKRYKNGWFLRAHLMILLVLNRIGLLSFNNLGGKNLFGDQF